MKSCKKFLLDDVKEHYHGTINYKEVLDNCYLDRGDNEATARLRKIIQAGRVIAIILVIMIVLLTAYIVYYHYSYDDKFDLSKKNKEYMESMCDDFNITEKYKISIDYDNNLYIYSGIKYQDDKEYNRIYFYVFDFLNPDNNIQLILDNTQIEVTDDSCGTLAIIEDETDTNVTFKIEINGKIKEYSLDLFK